MTRNNLSDHLAWLLRNSATSHPNVPPLPTPQNSLDGNTPDVESKREPPAALQADCKIDRTRTQVLSGGRVSSVPEISAAKPTNVSRYPDGQGQGGQALDAPETIREMGGLYSLGRSKKPSLVVQQQQQQQRQPEHQLLTPASTTGIGRLQQAHQAFLCSGNLGSIARARGELPPATSPKSKVESLALKTGAALLYGDEDEDGFSDVLDLTEVENFEDSSSVEAFGDDVRLWREDFAARPEPLFKQGKKRKSNEISKALTSPVLDTSKDDFPDIVELQRSCKKRSSPTSHTLNSTSKRGCNTAGLGASEKTQMRPNHRTIASEEKANSQATARGVCVSHSRQEDVKGSGLDSSFSSSASAVERTSSPGTDSDPAVHQKLGGGGETPPPKPRPARRSDIILDSDDEFLTPPTHNASLATDHMDLDDGAVLAAETPSRPSMTAGCNYEAPHLPNFNNPPHPPGCPKGANGAVLEVADTHADVTEKNEYLLRLFLRNPSGIQIRRQHLDLQIHKNSKEYARSLRERWPAEQRARVKKEAEPVREQRKALDEVVSHYEAYKSLNNEMEVLTEKLTQAFIDGIEIPNGEMELEELNDKIQETEKDLLKSIVAAGFEDLDFLRDPDHSIGASSPVAAPGSGPPQYPGGLTLTCENPCIPERNSQVILQTQFPPRNSASSEGHERAPPPRPIASASASTSEVPGMTRELGQRNRGFERRGAHATASVQPFREEDDSLFDDDDFFSTVDNPDIVGTGFTVASSKKRGAAAPSRGEVGRHPASDHFDDFSDEEMLAAASNFEQQQTLTRTPSDSRSSRAVLMETSGNATAPPRARVTAKSQGTCIPKASIPPELMKHPWSADVRRALKDRFRMSGFRHNQLEAINETLAGRDAFVLMPTGGGKSLCYQLPAVVNSGKTRGITVVISPLLSLMQDQVEHLNALNIAAGQLTGGMDAAARNKVLGAFDQAMPEHFLQLLYVTPEMVNKSQAFINGLTKLHQNKKLARIVIDEAHCVSQWGHDFRPDYKALGAVRRRFPGVPVMALTATATENVIVDVKHNLGMDSCRIFTQSFNRPNLYYEVRKKVPNLVDNIAELIQEKYKNMTGIVYTLSRKSAETIAKKLREHGIKAHHYHATIEPSEKARIQRDWQQGKIKVVVATIAFGMGIDKPNVRFVIHQQIPKSLEGYYQETGRAGRDGNPSDCVLYFAYGDIAVLKRMIMDGEGSDQQKERQVNMLNRIVSFCENQHVCRRVDILRYFGESFDPSLCNSGCDNCRTGRIHGNYEAQDFSLYAVAVLDIIERGPLTLMQCVDVMMGRKARDYGAMQQFGIAKKMKPHEVQRIIYTLTAEGALVEDNRIRKSDIAVTYYKLGPAAHAFRSGRRKLELVVISDEQRGSASRPKKASKKNDSSAGAASASARLPPSTNVSSPVRRMANRQKKLGAAPDSDDGHDDDDGGSDAELVGRLHDNGYEDDGFVVADGEADAEEEETDDDFEPVRTRHVASRRGQQRTLDELGPRISRDPRLEEAGVNEIHQEIITAFVLEAAQKEEEIRNQAGQRRNLFTQQQYREMAIRWTTSVAEMRRIPDIDKAKVEKYGPKFLPLIQRYHKQYREMMGEVPSQQGRSTRTVSGNHELIDLISSDDEAGNHPDLDSYDMDEAADGDDLESSRYFDEPISDAERARIRAFQAELGALNSQAQTAGTGSGINSRAKGGATGSGWRGGGKRSFSGRRGAAGGAASGVGGRRYARGRSASGGVTKRKAYGNSAGGGGGRGRGLANRGVKRSSGSGAGGSGSGIRLMAL
ncbi:hypothetical protein VTK73DRAFT_3219 [Phialemonium thermophilum]|uniref:DNA 3'-5' helicase n=1 Tax=Phialemonium thermophilum TaxID=223376 RepID=A0ABR3Y8D7_9PEZI